MQLNTFVTTPAATVAANHPLEPLSAEEIREAVSIFKAEKKPAPSVRFVMVTLNEPAKEAVLSFKTGSIVAREAFMILLDNATGRGAEAIVSLTDKKVVWHTELPDRVQPPIMLDEFVECEEAVKKSPEFLAALKKRGITDVSLVMVDPWSAGQYGGETEDDKKRRLSRALCWLRSEPNDNGYARPLEGIVAVVDLNEMKVLRVEDYGVVPLPPTSGNWERGYIKEMREAPKPLEIEQKDGPSFEVNGHEISWQKWKLRIGFNPREGLVLYTVTYTDKGAERPILYRASVAEMVVPYGDPAVQCYRKNAFDLGEYGIGMLANSLTLGCDCLGHIKYFDAHMTNSRGQVFTIGNAVCMHEEDFGILWKHTDWRTNAVEVRRSRRLVVSFIATVANYEYGFYWYFYQDGTIALEVKLSGIMNTTALHPGEKPLFGTEVAPQLNAPYHQHFFGVRLDMNVDGAENSVYEVNTRGLPEGESNPYGNAFRAEASLLANESAAQRTVNTGTARFWRVENPSKKNSLGVPTAYRLVPGENCWPFAQSSASLLKRAGFLSKNLWVTRYDREEKFPAGNYPNQNPGDDGLPKWTQANRDLVNTNLVLWYTFGHNHVPRMEDWPVMPVSYIGFALKPDGFFEGNPGLDIPPTPPKKSCCH
jgi:primary-amine oxidase